MTIAMHLALVLGCLIGFRLIAEIMIAEYKLRQMQASLRLSLLCAIWLATFAVLANSLFVIRSEASMMWQ